MNQYKVWIHIEEIDEDEDHYKDMGEPTHAATTPTLQDAEDFVECLVSVAPSLQRCMEKS